MHTVWVMDDGIAACDWYCVSLQGYMTGKDFARSVICSVHTSKIEDYLGKVDALPEELATAQVLLFRQLSMLSLLLTSGSVPVP